MRRAIVGIVMAAVALVVLVAVLVDAKATGWLAFDLKLSAAKTLVNGDSLYPDHLYDPSWSPTVDGYPRHGYPYPPLLAMLLVPFLVLPLVVAEYIGAVLAMAAMLGALWLVRVRDLRCLAAAALSVPLLEGSKLANVSALICLLVAAAWRWGAAPAGAAIALKLYAWPLAFWLTVTRGARQGLLTVAWVAGLVFVPWALIGFDGITRYVRLADEATEGTRGHTYALGMLDLRYAGLLAAGATVAALAACYWLRRDRAGSFSFALLAMLTASPVVWAFYFAIVFVAVAIRRPTLSPAWFVPLALYLVHGYMLGWWLVMGGLLVWCGLGAPGFALGRRSAVQVGR